MKTQTLVRLTAILLLSISVLACGNKKDDPTPNPSSRTIKFEVSGNFTGNMECNLLTQSGGVTYETIPSLPWSKEITYAASVASVTFTVVGLNGAVGQNVTIKVYRGGTLLSTTPTTATANGRFTLGIPPFIL